MVGKEIIVIFLAIKWVSELLILPENSSLASHLSPEFGLLDNSARVTLNC